MKKIKRFFAWLFRSKTQREIDSFEKSLGKKSTQNGKEEKITETEIKSNSELARSFPNSTVLYDGWIAFGILCLLAIWIVWDFLNNPNLPGWLWLVWVGLIILIFILISVNWIPIESGTKYLFYRGNVFSGVIAKKEGRIFPCPFLNQIASFSEGGQSLDFTVPIDNNGKHVIVARIRAFITFNPGKIEKIAALLPDSLEAKLSSELCSVITGERYSTDLRVMFNDLEKELPGIRDDVNDHLITKYIQHGYLFEKIVVNVYFRELSKESDLSWASPLKKRAPIENWAILVPWVILVVRTFYLSDFWILDLLSMVLPGFLIWRMRENIPQGQLASVSLFDWLSYRILPGNYLLWWGEKVTFHCWENISGNGVTFRIIPKEDQLGNALRINLTEFKRELSLCKTFKEGEELSRLNFHNIKEVRVMIDS